MDLDKLIDSMTLEIYANLKRAVELGRWDNGVKLTETQVADSLQLIIAYDNRHTPERERVGYIEPKEHQHCGSTGDDWQTLNIKDS